MRRRTGHRPRCHTPTLAALESRRQLDKVRILIELPARYLETSRLRCGSMVLESRSDPRISPARVLFRSHSTKGVAVHRHCIVPRARITSLVTQGSDSKGTDQG